ncbi:MAG: hypothetical protein R3E12_14820 [Candidatus Eisenbacteria bacterium]
MHIVLDLPPIVDFPKITDLAAEPTIWFCGVDLRMRFIGGWICPADLDELEFCVENVDVTSLRPHELTFQG